MDNDPYLQLMNEMKTIRKEIKELNEMYKSVLISKEEFEMLKNKLLKN